MNRRQVRRLIRRELQSPAYLDRMIGPGDLHTSSAAVTPEAFRKALDQHRDALMATIRKAAGAGGKLPPTT